MQDRSLLGPVLFIVPEFYMLVKIAENLIPCFSPSGVLNLFILLRDTKSCASVSVIQILLAIPEEGDVVL